MKRRDGETDDQYQDRVEVVADVHRAARNLEDHLNTICLAINQAEGELEYLQEVCPEAKPAIARAAAYWLPNVKRALRKDEYATVEWFTIEATIRELDGLGIMLADLGVVSD